MNTIVAIIIYDRFANLERWLDAWDQCDKYKTELVVIHNHDHPNHRAPYKKLCEKHGVKYFPRKNQGFDIGALRDVCHETLPNFPQFDELIWITDDTIPMRKDFVKYFKLQPGAGIKCVEVASKNAPLHVRTTGFSISKTTAKKLVFPDPLITKEHCYFFEHRGGSKTLMLQVQRMGLKVLMITDRPEDSPLWDTHNRPQFERWPEFREVFGKNEVLTPATPEKSHVTVICLIYNQYPEIIGSMINQTHKNWTLKLIHDGPNSTGLKEFVAVVNDPRIEYTETKKHVGLWGHPLRSQAIKDLKDTDYVVITNADNHHVPVYLERLLIGFSLPNTVGVYCSDMVHSYKSWQVIACSLNRGYIDCAGMMIRAEQAKEVGWRDTTSHSADWVFFDDLIKKYGAHQFRKVIGCLLIHN